MKLRIWQKISILMLIPISFEIAATAFLIQVLTTTEKTAERFENTKAALSEFHASQNNFNSAGIDIATVGMYRPDGSPPDFEKDRQRLELAKAGTLKSADIHPAVKEALNGAPGIFDQAISLVTKAETLYNNPTVPKRKKGSMMKNDVFELIMDADPLLKRIVEVETSMENLESTELDRSRWLIIVSSICVFACSLVITLIVGIAFYKSFGKRLILIEGNAEKVALGQTLPPALKGGDEIDELDRTLHEAAEYVDRIHEKEFAVLNKSSDVLFTIDDKFRIRSIGESVEQTWHYSVGDVLGRSIFTLLSESQAAKVRTILGESTSDASEHDFDVELICGDNNMREFAWKTNWNAKDNSYYCVARDISARKNVERAKQRLLAIASHDLRTPLMSVSANLSSLAMGRFGNLEPALNTALTESEQNLDKLMELIQSLLDLERMESTKANLDLGCVSALDVASEAISLVESDAQKVGVRIAAPSRDESIVADERRLVQVLTSLLQNAVSQSKPNQTVAVAITAFNNFAQISVRDQGPEISADEAEMVFEKYFQSRSKVQQNKRNSLSLALAKVLTEAQKGRIGVSSDKGKGNEFFVQFPKFILSGDDE